MESTRPKVQVKRNGRFWTARIVWRGYITMVASNESKERAVQRVIEMHDEKEREEDGDI